MGHSQLDLTGKTAVVIGGTSGIGLALAKGLAEAGANVVPTGRRENLVTRAVEEVRQRNRGSLAMTCDVTDAASLAKLRDAAVASFGSVEILVNCAGKTKRTPTLQVGKQEWNDIIETNLTGTLRACQAFAPHMIERRYGPIVNIASPSSFFALHEDAPYSPTKPPVSPFPNSLPLQCAP